MKSNGGNKMFMKLNYEAVSILMLVLLVSPDSRDLHKFISYLTFFCFYDLTSKL